MIRYSRQLKFLEKYGNLEQKHLNKKLVIVGCGGVGSVLAEQLVRGGFSNLVLIDIDLIDETNLQRQIFFEKDIWKVKSETLSKYLKKINKNIQVKVVKELLTKNNIEKICKKSDLIIDCTDNFETRKIINNFCINNKKDWIYNGAVMSEVMCCLFESKNNNFDKFFNNVKDVKCCDVGVLSATTFVAASICFTIILKYFLGIKENKIVKYDIWKNEIHKINF